MVTIRGQCVLLQNSLLKPKLPYESHLSRHTSEHLKNIVKILETRLQSSKDAPQWTKICKIHDVDKVHWCLVFKSFFCVLP